MKNLFAYGTLLVPEIWRAVVGKEFPSEPAILPGYEIRRVVNQVFPGISPSQNPDSQVIGRVFLQLDSKSLKRLDAYEGDLYQRTVVSLNRISDGPLNSDVFVIPNHHHHLLSTDSWNIDWFLNGPFSDYLTNLKENLRAPD